jgi:hypothetical protein
MTRSPKQIREVATLALREGRLHPDHWAEVDDLLLDERLDEAAELLTPEALFLALPSLPDGCDGHLYKGVSFISGRDALSTTRADPPSSLSPLDAFTGGSFSLYGSPPLAGSARSTEMLSADYERQEGL